MPPMTMPADIPVLAVIVVRDGELPAGADETVAEAGGAALVLGSGTRNAAGLLDAASRVWLLERSSVAPGAVAAALAQVLAGVPMVLLPASPDGRDLAPRLAAVLCRPLLAGAVRCAPDEVELTRLDDHLSLRVAVDGPVVATLRPGFRGRPEQVTLAEITALAVPEDKPGHDAESIDVLQPEPTKQAAAIAKAAAAAAPSKAGPIVIAVCQAVPSAYRDIAVAVSQVVPGAAREILNAVASALPNLRLPIEQALAGYAGNVPSVADTLSLAANTLQSSTISDTVSSAMARGPAVGPPYIPLTTTPRNVTPGTSGQVPTRSEERRVG